MNQAVDQYLSDSILQATLANATCTTQRTSQLAAYLRLNSASEHAGGHFSGGIELHLPSNINSVRIGCSSNSSSIFDLDTLVVSEAWIDITGVFKNGHRHGIFHRAKVPITKTVVRREIQFGDSTHADWADADPTSPGTDFLTPGRYAAAAKRRSGQHSFHSQTCERSSLPSTVGVGEPDEEGNMHYLLHNSKVVIPYKISVDPRLPNSFSYDGAEITYWVSIVLSSDQGILGDSVAFQARQVEVFQLESFVASDLASSSSSASSRVAMGGSGALDVTAWIASPSFGIIEGSIAKVTLYIRNFTKKKTQGIKLELFRKVEPELRVENRESVVKITEEAYYSEDQRFESGYSAHVTVGIRIPIGSYSSNGTQEVSISYMIKSSILVPLSEGVTVVSPIRIVRPDSFPEGIASKPLPKLPISVGTQTLLEGAPPGSDDLPSKDTYETRLRVAQYSLETILQESTTPHTANSEYYWTTSSDDETMSTGSYSDSESDDTPPRSAYIAHSHKPVYIPKKAGKRKPRIPLMLDTTWDRDASSYGSHEIPNAGLTSDSSRLSQWAYQSSSLSPQTPAEYLDERQVWVRTMSAPNLTIPLNDYQDMKHLSIPSMGCNVGSSLVDIYKRNNISRHTHVRAVSWRSRFDETHSHL